MTEVRNVKEWLRSKRPSRNSGGRPRLYFGFDLDRFQLLRENATSLKPNLTQRTNTGYAWDGEEAWQCKILEASVLGFYWVGLRGAHSPPNRVHWFPSPIAKKDVLPVLNKYQPGLQWSWYTDGGQPTLSPNWPGVMSYQRGFGYQTFFALHEGRKQVYVGGASHPAARVGVLFFSEATVSRPLLLGVCLDPDVQRARQVLGCVDRWVKTSPKVLKQVAVWCSAFAHEVLLEWHGDHAAERRITTTPKKKNFVF